MAKVAHDRTSSEFMSNSMLTKLTGKVTLDDQAGIPDPLFPVKLYAFDFQFVK